MGAAIISLLTRRLNEKGPKKVSQVLIKLPIKLVVSNVMYQVPRLYNEPPLWVAHLIAHIPPIDAVPLVVVRGQYPTCNRISCSHQCLPKALRIRTE
jgi:hypothetical protein